MAMATFSTTIHFTRQGIIAVRDTCGLAHYSQVEGQQASGGPPCPRHRITRPRLSLLPRPATGGGFHCRGNHCRHVHAVGGLLSAILSILAGTSELEKVIALGTLIGLPVGLAVGLLDVLARRWRSDQVQDDSRSKE